MIYRWVFPVACLLVACTSPLFIPDPSKTPPSPATSSPAATIVEPSSARKQAGVEEAGIIAQSSLNIEPAPCPEDMVDVGLCCIDSFEAPNERGANPLRMQTAHDAEMWCKERGKRLCNEDEWVRACEGPQGLPFPYGKEFRNDACNHDKRWKPVNWGRLARWPDEVARAEADKLDQSEPSGARETCKSEEGVYDLTGNVAEWVLRTRSNPTNGSHVVKGCYWGKCFRPPHTPTCEYVNYAHEAGFRSYEFGFRCCQDRTKDGQRTDKGIAGTTIADTSHQGNKGAHTRTRRERVPTSGQNEETKNQTAI